MDENIISVIARKLSQKDLFCFSLVNKQCYHYCRHTNTEDKKCDVRHNTYHFKLTLVENARLLYCMNLLSSLKTLYDNGISLHMYSLQISLVHTCGTVTKITLGRELVINCIVYSYDNKTAICDLRKGLVQNESKVYNIDYSIEKIKHKLNSILLHKYARINRKIINNIQRDYQLSMVQSFNDDVEKYFIKLLIICGV